MSSKANFVLKKPSFDDSFKESSITEEDEDVEEFSTSQDLPSFKSVIFRGQRPDADTGVEKKDLFFDESKGDFVNLDNFAFANSANHFDEDASTTSSLALLDSRILDDTSTTANLDDSRIIVEELKRNLEQELQSSSSQPNSLDVSFDDNAKPKIKSPREVTTPPKRKTSPSLKKLSAESQKLPSKSSDDSATNSTGGSKYAKKRPSSAVTSKGSSKGIQRKLSLEKNSRKLGQNKSHSATNLHKLSVKDYHESFQQQRRLSSTSIAPDEAERSSSYDSLYNLSLKELAGKKADYSHVQSKVRQYIYGDSSRPGSKMRHRTGDVYGKSFVLSPGRKSLSMSNLANDCSNCSRRSSCKSDLKSFLSAKNLNDLQLQLSRNLSQSQSGSLHCKSDQVSRLLDHQVSDNEDNFEANEVICEVEDLLQLAMDERKGKIEAIQGKQKKKKIQKFFFPDIPIENCFHF